MSVRLAAAEVFCAQLPLARRLQHATADTASLDAVVLRLTAEDGSVGAAEVRGNGAYATGIDTSALLATLAGPITRALVGRDAEQAVAAAEQISDVPLVWCAVQGAVLDLQSRRRRLPARRVLCDRALEELPTHIGVPFTATPQAAAQAAEAAVSAGFQRLKVRVGAPSLHDDLTRLTAIREAVGGEIHLAIDANGAWHPDQAISALTAMSAYQLSYAEQPTPAGDLQALRVVRDATCVPIVADETVTDAAAVAAVADADAADGVHLKLEKAGTVDRLAVAVRTARDAGLRVYLGQMDQGQLGCALTAQVAATLHADGYEVCGYHHLSDDIASGLTTHGGALQLPTGPGLGVTVDWARLEPAQAAT